MFKDLKYTLLLCLFPPVAYVFLVLLRATFTIEHVNRERVERLREHGRMSSPVSGMADCSPCLLLIKGAEGKVLISRHRDGEFIARVIRYFGHGTIRGSYRKGSVSSVREMLGSWRKGRT